MKRPVVYLRTNNIFYDCPVLINLGKGLSDKAIISDGLKYVPGGYPVIRADADPKDAVKCALISQCDSTYLGISDPIFRHPSGLAKHSQFKVGLNGYTALAEYNNVDCPSDRWEVLQRMFQIEVKPYRKQGDHITVIVNTLYNVNNVTVSIYKWANDVIDVLKQTTDRPIKIWADPEWHNRRHIGLGLRNDVEVIQDDSVFENCHATVSYSSHKAVETTIAGIPNIPISDHCFTSLLQKSDLTQIDDISLPDRDQWLWNLAYTQWGSREIKKHLPIEHLRNKISELQNQK
ncbi:MAG: hypothetical protein N0C84_01290 [Candidatus Thiodiazotropha taylori]|uniref:Uncharacterized protein n=1 Tax=Candidatus Thiodiazotropha taylori TaxID=2792791 RepID=A0A9E4N254_9GAMM|nr:hypothetical protein [Candidatus Thiodiazotropha taylori]MCW4255081.1 hypothetical protein [Candidatus Thiodiazotropha taylori]